MQSHIVISGADGGKRRVPVGGVWADGAVVGTDANGLPVWVTAGVGPPGPAGPQGPAGAQGIQGIQGIQGPAGPTFQFPVGSVFIAVVSTNPATLLGYGTWAALGAGRTLVGFDGADADFNAAKKTGGAKTVAAVVGNHAAAATSAASAGVQKIGTTTSTVTLAAHTHNTPVLAHTVTPTSVVQPYITVYFWERTA